MSSSETAMAAAVTGEAMENEMKRMELKQEHMRQIFEKLSSESSGLILFSVQWKDLEDHFDAAKSSLRRQMDEIELKRKQMEWKQKYIRQKTKEIESREAKLEYRRNDIDATYELVGKCYEMVREKEREFDEKMGKVEEKDERVMRRLMREKKRERKVEERERRLEREEERLELREQELGVRVMEVMKRAEEEIELKEEFQAGMREFDEGGGTEDQFKVFKVRAVRRVEELEARERNVGIVERELAKRFDEVVLKEKKFAQDVNEFKKRERELEKRMKEIELKEERLKGGTISDARAESLVVDVEEGEVLLDPSYADIRFNVTMDGRALQMFLNGRVNDHEAMRGEVIRGLQMSCDPAKLVLDAMVGFYADDLEHGDVGFDLSIVRKSCVLLLEQLMQMNPNIDTPIRERAMRLAEKWTSKMNVARKHYLEVVGFLQLAATYELSYGFNKDELSKLIETAAQHLQAPTLCRSLGLTDKVPGIIQNLIEGGQPFDALRLVFAFELLIMFPPIPILRAYLSSTFSESKEFCNTGGVTIEKECKVIDTKIDALLSVLRCVKEYKLDTQYPVDKLKQLIFLLRMQKSKCRFQPQEVHENQLIADYTLTSSLDTSMEPESGVCEDMDMAVCPAPNISLDFALSSSYNELSIVTHPDLTSCAMNGHAMMSYLSTNSTPTDTAAERKPDVFIPRDTSMVHGSNPIPSTAF